MPASFGLIPGLPQKIKDKKLRYLEYKNRSIMEIKEFKKKIDSKLETMCALS